MTPEASRADAGSILIANDHEWSARSIETILTARAYTVHRAFTGSQAIARAMAVSVDAVFLDQQLPDLSGPAVCRRLRDLGICGPSVPVFVTTSGPAGRQERVAAYEAGAWEFWGEPLDAEVVLLKLGHLMKAKRLVDRRGVDHMVDDVTGLDSEVGFRRRARGLANDAFRRRRSLAVAVFAPREPWSRLGGDDANRWARSVGSQLLARGRSSDAIGRLGPLEFAVVAAETTAEQVDGMVTRLRGLIEGSTAEPRGPAVEFRVALAREPDLATASRDVGTMLNQARLALHEADSLARLVAV